MPHAPAATLVRGTWHPGSILCRDNLRADGFVAHSNDWDGGYPASSCCSKGTTKTLAKYGFLTMSAQCHTSHWCLKKEKARVFLLVFHEIPLQMKLLSTAWPSWHLGWPRGSQINKVLYEKKNKKTEVKKKNYGGIFGLSHSEAILYSRWNQKIYSCSSIYSWLMTFSNKGGHMEDIVFMATCDSRDFLIFRKVNWKNRSWGCKQSH